MKSFALSLILILAACSKSKENIINGEDNSGNYESKGIECYDTSYALTVTATLLGVTEFLDIKGNSIEIDDVSVLCTGIIKGTVVFHSDTEIMDSSNLMSTTNTGNTCNMNLTIDHMNGGTITPASLTLTFNDNAVVPDWRASYVKNSSTGTIGAYTSLVAVQGSPSDMCFFVYKKY